MSKPCFSKRSFPYLHLKNLGQPVNLLILEFLRKKLRGVFPLKLEHPISTRIFFVDGSNHDCYKNHIQGYVATKQIQRTPGRRQ